MLKTMPGAAVITVLILQMNYMKLTKTFIL